ncbi:hypothetical protein GGR52DRAFT_591028 [Hypoxylon sp. FL1284]|nr:hypothetical protein GGR52DRAFT_591028 [Hypoxylon sp. FL1284]
MAPVPDNNSDDDHYDAGAPLDGGSSPAVLAGSDKHFSPTGLEIGVITAVVVIVLFSLVGLFVWRSRKNRAARMAAEPIVVGGAASSSSHDPSAAPVPADEHLFHPVESRDSREPVAPPKFEFADAAQEHPPSPSPRSTRNRRGGKRDSVEEHEIAARV